MLTIRCTNSQMVSYTRLSPNCTKPRNHDIDTISIHTMAGNCSVETCGEIFADSARQASSNYGIGSDGRVAMYVEEHNRSWCSSNRANDMRAVTIEVASINNTDYKCSEAAYVSLIKLCVDICKRNNIKRLIWSTNKNERINHSNGCNMTVHRDFKNKACPGDWLYNHMGKIAEEVNKLLTTGAVDSIISTPNVNNGDLNEELGMYQFLKSKNISDYFIFGLMANLYAESGIRANNLQNSFENKLKMNDEVYTKSVDNGSYNNFIKDKAGYGYPQWTYWSRKQNLYNYAKSKDVSIANPNMQREFLWQELNTTYKGLVSELKASKSLYDATILVLTKFEKPADQSQKVKDKRHSYAKMLYNKYAGTNIDDKDKIVVPFKVRIIDSALNIRKEPNKNSIKTGCITDHGVYTITEIAYVGTVMWGKLKSGKGWICLTKYTEKL